jgi:hypothetical protein
LKLNKNKDRILFSLYKGKKKKRENLVMSYNAKTDPKPMQKEGKKLF